MAEEQKFDARLAEGVSYFEQMLEIMPEDRTTLEFLIVAYEQLGEPVKGQKALRDLAQLLVKERDVEALRGLLPRLEASSDAGVQAVLLKVRTLMAPEPDLTPEAPRALTEDERIAARVATAVEAELALVRELAAADVCGPELTETVTAHLESSPADGRVFLISALQILEKENPSVFERAVGFLADRHGMPPVPLSAFDPARALVEGVSSVELRLRGAVPFARMGATTLVAVLNPSDEALRAALAPLGDCRFYLAEPTAVEEKLARLFPQEADA